MRNDEIGKMFLDVGKRDHAREKHLGIGLRIVEERNRNVIGLGESVVFGNDGTAAIRHAEAVLAAALGNAVRVGERQHHAMRQV